MGSSITGFIQGSTLMLIQDPSSVKLTIKDIAANYHSAIYQGEGLGTTACFVYLQDDSMAMKYPSSKGQYQALTLSANADPKLIYTIRPFLPV